MTLTNVTNSTGVVSSVVSGVVLSDGVTLWIRLLALVGLLWLAQTTLKTGINVVYAFAYLYGIGKWALKKMSKNK